jgi:hypothetical protein
MIVMAADKSAALFAGIPGPVPAPWRKGQAVSAANGLAW